MKKFKLNLSWLLKAKQTIITLIDYAMDTNIKECVQVAFILPKTWFFSLPQALGQAFHILRNIGIVNAHALLERSQRALPKISISRLLRHIAQLGL